MNKGLQLWHRLKEATRVDRELGAVIVVAVLGALLSLAILFVPKVKTADPNGHGHGGEEESGGHAEEEGHADEHGDHEKVEGVTMDDEVAETAGVVVEAAAARDLEPTLKLRGRIVVNREKHALIVPRFPGTVTRVMVELGQSVKAGAALAVVESAAARATVDVRSGIDGEIVMRRAVRGVYAREKEPLFVVADLSDVWAELTAAEQDFSLLKSGSSVKVVDREAGAKGKGKVSYISPSVDPDTQGRLIRVTLKNDDRQWLPGSFVEGEVSAGDVPVAVAIKRSALQDFEGRRVVFVRREDRFEARDVVLGAKDRDYVEVTSGIKVGESYAANNSFIVKAELLKSTAEHEH